MGASRKTKVVALLTGFLIAVPAHQGAAGEAETSANLQFLTNVPFKGGSDIEFEDRVESRTVTQRTYRVVRTKRVRCSRRVICRRGVRYKTIRIRPRRVYYNKIT
ncbi:MAG TPA: hypothetical protein VNA87_02625, partial [Actinomycetota bacterium]|nr:hypothetical protein [Actinomycetota bacterium]